MSCPFRPCVNRRKNNKASGSMSVDSVHLSLPFDFPVLITARESESSFTDFLINDLIHHFAKENHQPNGNGTPFCTTY